MRVCVNHLSIYECICQLLWFYMYTYQCVYVSIICLCVSLYTYTTHTQYIHLFHFLEVLIIRYKLISTFISCLYVTKRIILRNGVLPLPTMAPNIDISLVSLFFKNQLTEICWVRRLDLCWRESGHRGLSWFFY